MLTAACAKDMQDEVDADFIRAVRRMQREQDFCRRILPAEPDTCASSIDSLAEGPLVRIEPVKIHTPVYDLTVPVKPLVVQPKPKQVAIWKTIPHQKIAACR